MEEPKIVLFLGKGGVGKTLVSQCFAMLQPDNLWVEIENPSTPTHLTPKKTKSLQSLNLSASECFEEYVQKKLSGFFFSKIIAQSKVLHTLFEAAPGMKELVLLGKVWFENKNDHSMVVDMPSTGFALSMFHAIKQFSELFQNSLVQTDAKKMFETYSNPKKVTLYILTLPEETPLKEALEAKEEILEIFPNQKPILLVNKKWPYSGTLNFSPTTSMKRTDSWIELSEQRAKVEAENLSLLSSHEFFTINELPLSNDLKPAMKEQLSLTMKEWDV